MKKRWYILYIAIVLVMLLIPLAAFGSRTLAESTENRELSEFPGLMVDGKPNIDFLADLGIYFEEHFAFRGEMVGIHAKLMNGLFGTSASEKVINGKNGWLYYGETLDDYQGTGGLSERSLFSIAHNLSLMKDLTEALGAKFYYTVAPNKNTLYGENMPDHYQKGTENNLDRLVFWLEEEGVPYIDLKHAFLSEEEVLYLKRDSHWNNKGAILAYNEIMKAIGISGRSYGEADYRLTEDYVGDLNEMLYSVLAEPESNYEYCFKKDYSVVGAREDVEASKIETENPFGEGKLLMYRDSFGNTLFPLLANHFLGTYFTRLTPYALNDVATYRPDYVIVERVERRISSVIEAPPIMQGPTAWITAGQEADTDTSIEIRKSGAYRVIEGILDPEYLETRDKVYVSVHSPGQPDGNGYEAFGTLTEDGENGYQLYLLEQNIPEGDYEIEIVLSGEGGGSKTIKKKIITEQDDMDEERN